MYNDLIDISQYITPGPSKVQKNLYDWDFCTFGQIETFNLKCQRFQQKVNS